MEAHGVIYGESFNALFDSVERVERHIGLRYYLDYETINGRLNNLEMSPSSGIAPYCEVDVLITGDNFSVVNTPILIGDAWVVNNSVMVTVDQGNSNNKVLHEWGDVEFVGNIGTLMGANGAYDGMVLTLTYFYNQTMLYYSIVFNDGYPGTEKRGDSFFDLVLEDEVAGPNQKIFIDSKGRVSSFDTQDPISGDDTFIDETTGATYEMYAENGNINWRTI